MQPRRIVFFELRPARRNFEGKKKTDSRKTVKTVNKPARFDKNGRNYYSRAFHCFFKDVNMYNALDPASGNFPGKRDCRRLEHIRLFYRLAVALNEGSPFVFRRRSILYRSSTPRPDADIPPVIANPSAAPLSRPRRSLRLTFPGHSPQGIQRGPAVSAFRFSNEGLVPHLFGRRARLDPNIP